MLVTSVCDSTELRNNVYSYIAQGSFFYLFIYLFIYCALTAAVNSSYPPESKGWNGKMILNDALQIQQKEL